MNQKTGLTIDMQWDLAEDLKNFDLGGTHPDDFTDRFGDFCTLTITIKAKDGEARPVNMRFARMILYLFDKANGKDWTEEDNQVLKAIANHCDTEVPVGSPEWFAGMEADDARRIQAELEAMDQRDDELWGDCDDYDDEPLDIDYEGLGYDPYAGQELDDEPIDYYGDWE